MGGGNRVDTYRMAVKIGFMDLLYGSLTRSQ